MESAKIWAGKSSIYPPPPHQVSNLLMDGQPWEFFFEKAVTQVPPRCSRACSLGLNQNGVGRILISRVLRHGGKSEQALGVSSFWSLRIARQLSNPN